SYRDVADYRVNASQGYKIGLAVSKDGISWDKRYDETGITPSAEGWDSAMIEYPHVFEHGGYYYMLYNGNGFGKDGFGYAIMRKA
ncbi:MAG TPA: hypothetical protein VG603_05735, partial [Chitinophagales bacterium]|nr:hypothetical protein [Chitinophagales bacterium]